MDPCSPASYGSEGLIRFATYLLKIPLRARSSIKAGCELLPELAQTDLGASKKET
jgi:hypothetical protein